MNPIKKTSRANKRIQQYCQIQDQHTKDNCFSIQQQSIIQKGISENNYIYNNIQKNKLPRNKFNQIGAKIVYGKLYNIVEKD